MKNKVICFFVSIFLSVAAHAQDWHPPMALPEWSAPMALTASPWDGQPTLSEYLNAPQVSIIDMIIMGFIGHWIYKAFNGSHAVPGGSRYASSSLRARAINDRYSRVRQLDKPRAERAHQARMVRQRQMEQRRHLERHRQQQVMRHYRGRVGR